MDPIKGWRDDVGRRLLGLDFEPLTDDPFHADLAILAADDVTCYSDAPLGRTYGARR